MIVPVVHNQHNKFTVARIHFSLDPEKNTPEWIAKSQEGMTDRDGKPTPGWFREYDINYEYFAGKPFYPEFKEYNISKVPIEYHQKEILYRGWDYGFHHPCCVITKLNEKDQWCWMKVILGEDEDIKNFGIRVRNFCLSEYPGAKYIDADDIAGTQVSDKSEQTSRQMLNLIGIYPTGRKQEIAEGATIIRNKLKIRIDGQPGLLIDPREQILIDMFKGGLHYPEVKEGQPQKEEYQKDGYYDHCFVAGTKVLTDSGEKRIEHICNGDLVIIRDGSYKKVIRSGKTRIASVKTVKFSNGKKLIGTGDHPIWVKNKGWVTIDSLRYGDIIQTCETLIDQNVNQNKSFLTVKDITDTQNQIKKSYRTIFRLVEGAKDFMLQFGNSIMEKFQLAITFIIKIVIHSTIQYPTWSVLQYRNTSALIPNITFITTKNIEINKKGILKKSDHLLLNGIDQKKEENGIEIMEEWFLETGHLYKKRVCNVANYIKQKIKSVLNSAQTIVSQNIEEVLKRIWREGNVSFVKQNLSLTDIQKQKHVGRSHVFVLSVEKHSKAKVYNLTVSEIPEYFANGVLVHNCGDAARYIAAEMFTLTGQHELINYGMEHKNLSYQQPGMGEDIMQDGVSIQDTVGGDMGGEL